MESSANGFQSDECAYLNPFRIPIHFHLIYNKCQIFLGVIHVEISQRKIYPDVLRIASTLAVITIHTACILWKDMSPQTFEWQVLNFYNSISRWCVPVFVMISGIFFLDPEKNIDARLIWKKYIPRMVLAIAVFTLLYRIPGLVDSIINENLPPKKIAYLAARMFAMMIFDNGWYHLWYLYMIIGLYMLVPLFRIMVRNATKKDLEYFLLIVFIFSSLLQQASSVLVSFNEHLKIYLTHFTAFGYGGYLVAGYYFSRYGLSKRNETVLLVLGILSLVFTIVAQSVFCIFTGENKEMFFGYFAPNVMVSAFFVFVFARKLFGSRDLSEKSSGMICGIARCTFGIYLLHDFCIQVFEYLGFTCVSINPILAVPLRVLASFLICLVLVLAWKKVTGKRKSC